MNQTIEILSGPTPEQFVRAVIPVAVDKFEANTWIPLGSWFINGIQAQMEPVTRAWDGCPDSIELTALVNNTVPNKVTTLNVTFQDGVKPDTTTLPTQFGSFRIELVDEQNRSYEFLFTSEQGELVKNGPYHQIRRISGNLTRLGTRLVGVVVYLHRYAGSDLIDLELFAHNGLTDPVIGNIYFKAMSIFSENGHRFFPKSCSNRPCGASFAGGYKIAKTDHYYWPKQAGFTRRFTLVPAAQGIPRKELRYRQDFGGTGFATEWSDNFGVAKTGIGQVTNDLVMYGNDGLEYKGRAALKRQSFQEFAALRAALETGESAEWVGVYAHAYGPFHPFYMSQQGAVSGFGIHHYAGWKLCWEELAAQHLFAAMNVERQPWNAWLSSGKPKTAADFAVEGGGVIQFDFAPYDFGINGIPAFVNTGDYNAGPASRELDTYPPHDAQHQARYLKPLQTLAYNNDYLAKELLLQAAEVDYLYHNLYPQKPGWFGGQNLTAMLGYANANPKQGGIMGRGRCWPIDGVMSYYHLASPEWRTKVYSWILKMAECLVKSQMPTGWNNRFPGDVENQLIETANLPRQYDVAQTFEVEFEDWVKRTLLVALPPQNRYRNSLSQSIVRSANSLFSSAFNKNGNYRWFVAVGHNHGLAMTQGELNAALSSGNEEIFQGWYVLNNAILASQELGLSIEQWMPKILKYRLPAATPYAKIQQLSKLASEDWNNHLPQAMGLMKTLDTYILGKETKI